MKRTLLSLLLALTMGVSLLSAAAPASAEPEAEETAKIAETEAFGEWEQTAAEEALNAAENEEPAASGACGENLTWTLDDSGTLTISGEGAMADYKIYPDYQNTPWYSQRKSIVSVVIESGVTGIGQEAFDDCANLTDVTIPDSVTGIGENAFQLCISLEHIEIPGSVTRMEEGAFCGCESLKSITIPDSVTSIAGWTFSDCAGLTSAAIGSGAANIGEEAFGHCGSLTDITIPDSVQSIGKNAFWNCTGLTSAAIGNGAASIGESAFWGCESLTTVTIGSSVTSIEDTAFCWCTSLSHVIFLGGAPEIGGEAFKGVTATAYYYGDTDGWMEDVRQNYGGNIEYGRLTWIPLSDKDLFSADMTVFAARTDGSAWDGGVTLAVTRRTEDILSGAAKAEIGLGDYTVCDISLITRDGEAVPLDGSVMVRLAVPEGYDGAKCAVFRVETDGALTDMGAEYDGGMLRFAAGALGTFAAGETYAPETPAPGPVSPDNPDDPDSPDSPDNPNNPDDLDGPKTENGEAEKDRGAAVSPDTGSGIGPDTEPEPEPDTILPGDVNADGAVNAKDVTVLFQYVNKQRDSMPNMDAGNVNGDGDINAKDVTRLFQFANKQIDGLEK